MSLTPVMEVSHRSITSDPVFHGLCLVHLSRLHDRLHRSPAAAGARTQRHLKNAALPLSPSALALCKWIVLLALAFFQCALMTGLYFICATVVSQSLNVSLMADTSTVLMLAGDIFLSSCLCWLFTGCSASACRLRYFYCRRLASMVPTVLMINVKIWYLYPPCYPFYIVTQKYGEFCSGSPAEWDLFPWIPAAVIITVICLIISCLRFGQAERR